jgi:hypothetical protein
LVLSLWFKISTIGNKSGWSVQISTTVFTAIIH